MSPSYIVLLLKEPVQIPPAGFNVGPQIVFERFMLIENQFAEFGYDSYLRIVRLKSVCGGWVYL